LPQFGSPFGAGYTPPIVAQLVPVPQPGYLPVLCVLSIVLGVIAALSGAITMLAPEYHGRYDPHRFNRATESLEDIENRAYIAERRYLFFFKPLNGLQGVVGIVMIVGAAFALQRRRPGDMLLRVCFAATLVVGLLHLLPFILQTIELQSVAADMQAKSRQSTGPEAVLAYQFGLKLAARSTLGLMFGIAWLLLKLGLFGHGFVYLGQPQVRAALR